MYRIYRVILMFVMLIKSKLVLGLICIKKKKKNENVCLHYKKGDKSIVVIVVTGSKETFLYFIRFTVE